MKVIGITGPTGAGKTTALRVLENMGYEIIDCDALYHEMLKSDESLKQLIREVFGDVFLPDGNLDRKTLANKVFIHADQLAKLNKIVFFTMSNAIEAKILNSTSYKGIVIDGITLIESGLSNMCSMTIAIIADPKIRLKRIMQRDHLTEAEAQIRIDAQKPDTWYKDNCQFFLKNDLENQFEFSRVAERFFRESLSL